MKNVAEIMTMTDSDLMIFAYTPQRVCMHTVNKLLIPQ